MAGWLCFAFVWPMTGSAAAGSPPLPVKHRFVRFGPGQGLSSVINDLAVDRQGYVWAATGDGLARYDGTRFRFWRREPGVDSSLPDNDLVALALDEDDRVWVASPGHLSVLDPTHRGFVPVRFEGEAAVCGRDITAISTAVGGGVWVGAYTGELCKISRSGPVRRGFSIAEINSLNAVISRLYPLGSDDLLIGTDVGLYRYQSGVIKEIAPRMLRGAQVFRIVDDSEGGIWIGTDRGLYRYALNGKVRSSSWVLPSLASNGVVLNDKRGTYWIGTAAGLFQAPTTHGPVVMAHGDRRDDGLSSGVFAQVMDREGGLWFASYSQGLSYLPPEHERFAVLDEVEGMAIERTDPFAVAADGKGGFWIVGSRMLYALRAGEASLRPLASAESLGEEWLQTLARCPDGRLWLASFHGVVEYDPSFGRRGRSLRFPDDGVRTPQALLCTDDGRLWVSLFGGGLRIHAPDGQLLHELAPEAVLGASGQDYAKLQPGPDGRPWLSDGQRLRRWNGQRFEAVEVKAGEAIQSFVFAAPQTLWVARFGSLERYEWRNEGLRLRERIGSDDGLPMTQVAGILAAGNDQLWLSTARGLLQYDGRNRRLRNFGMSDGLPDIDFMLAAPVRGNRGPALALSKQGLALFDPDRPLSAPRASALAIETVDLRRGEDTVTFSGREGGALHAVMRPRDRDLRVTARVMSFADPAGHRYRFRLRGYDPDWVVDTRGERVFSTLPPGRYLLEVQGANADGVWSPTRRIDLWVQAPWWRSSGAWLLYAAAAVALLWWLSYLDRIRLRRRHDYQLIQQKRALAEEASLAKSRFLANLGHEVRTPMTGVLGMSELLLSTALDSKQQGQVHAIRRAGGHLLRLVNDALDLARIEAGRFELDTADFELDVLIDDTAALMRPLAERKGLALVVEIADDVRGGWQGDATRLSQILLNLLGNAIRFTARGEVGLSVDGSASHGLRFTVRDTGPGLDEEQQSRLFRRFEQAEGARTASRYGGSGLGLAICRELAVAMGGGIELRSAPGEGAAFIVHLPLLRAAGSAMATSLPSRAAVSMPRMSLQVLLIEDDAIVADVLIGMLQAQGHRVVHAAHALAALAEVATRRFDLAVIDLDLPGMDGVALARHLRMQTFTQPMVAVTARADHEAESQSREAGFDAFLRKPLTGDMLAEVIDAMVVPASSL
jgi:signal transduction histidine kinase/ligand-binding sensor domain-containing protein/CheY-like chemotaxis protein